MERVQGAFYRDGTVGFDGNDGYRDAYEPKASASGVRCGRCPSRRCTAPAAPHTATRMRATSGERERLTINIAHTMRGLPESSRLTLRTSAAAIPSTALRLRRSSCAAPVRQWRPLSEPDK